MTTDADDNWSRALDEERRLAPWRQVIWMIEAGEKPKEALRELAKLLRQGGPIPDFAAPVLAELIDPQHGILDIKLAPKRTGAFGRLKHKESKECDLVEAIEAEMNATGCTQEAAIEKIAPSQQRTAERILKAVRQRRKQIQELLGPFGAAKK
jgi:hypothetical protein